MFIMLIIAGEVFLFNFEDFFDRSINNQLEIYPAKLPADVCSAGERPILGNWSS